MGCPTIGVIISVGFRDVVVAREVDVLVGFTDDKVVDSSMVEAAVSREDESIDAVGLCLLVDVLLAVKWGVAALTVFDGANKSLMGKPVTIAATIIHVTMNHSGNILDLGIAIVESTNGTKRRVQDSDQKVAANRPM